MSNASLSKILAWVITAIVLPGGIAAVSAGMNKLDALAQQVQTQAQEQVRMNGIVDRLEDKIESNVATGAERTQQRKDDIAEIKDDVRELTLTTQRLAIAVERLTVQHAEANARRTP